MRILVTGASGFLGRAVVAAGAREGHAMIAASRAGAPVGGASESIATGDLSGSEVRLDFSGIDAVIHCAARVHVLKREEPEAARAAFDAMNATLPVALAKEAKAAGVGRFVQISSVAAIASQTPPGEVFTDAAPPAPATPYGEAKLAADSALAGLAGDRFAAISLRPPAIYGPGVGAWFAMLMRAARAGVPLPLGAIRNARSFAFAGNVADAALVAASARGDLVQSGSFIVTDSLPISTAALYRKLLAAYGHGDRVWNWPEQLVRPLARMALGERAGSLLGDAAFDGSRFASTFGWQPRVDMDEALRLTLSDG